MRKTQHQQACRFVIAALDFGSSLGRYMMMPTQLNSAPGFSPTGVAAVAASAEGPAAAAAAGLMGLLLLDDHLCSIGLGAGILLASISRSKSSMYARSAPSGSLHSIMGHIISDTQTFHAGKIYGSPSLTITTMSARL